MFNRKISTVTHMYPQCTHLTTHAILSTIQVRSRELPISVSVATHHTSFYSSPSQAQIPHRSENTVISSGKKLGGEGKGTSSLSASTPRGRCFCCNSLIVKYSFSRVSTASSRSRV